MPEKKKIMYLMHVDWRWIKQRPHLIAENLSGKYDIDVYFGRSFHKKSNMTSCANPKNLRLVPIIRLPMFLNKYRIFRKLAVLLNRRIMKQNAPRYDIIWFCHPIFTEDVLGLVRPGAKIVYDCMDNVLEFPSVKKDTRLRKYLYGLEKNLARNADLILCSALNLQKRMRVVYGVKNTSVIYNGAQPAVISRKTPSIPFHSLSSRKRIITYIGTVSEWMDFELIVKSLKEFPDIAYHFFGPVSPGLSLPAHPGLIFHGPVPHEEVPGLMIQSDLLVMPFQLSELILSVDPVKLYEYIYSGKPVLAVRYPETEKFGRFAYLYKGKKEYFEVLRRLVNSRLKTKLSPAEHRSFAGKNTWAVRAKEIDNLISQIL